MTVLRIAAASLFLLLAAAPASAASPKQVVEGCRESVGRPIVVACMKGGGSSLEPAARRPSPRCRPAFRRRWRSRCPRLQRPRQTPTAADIAKIAPVSLVAPPRTVSDITAILDQQKPDPARTEQLQAAADAAAPGNLKGLQLADFHYKRGQARAQLGRNEEALADAELAVSNGKGADYSAVLSRYEQFLMRRLRDAGQHKRANEIVAKQLAAFSAKGKGRLFGLNFSFLERARSATATSTAAEGYAARNRDPACGSRRRPNFPIYGANWQAYVEDGDARVAEARGLYADAEANYRKASQSYLATLKYLAQWESKPPEGEIERAADWALALEGRVKVRQGRVGEGEADVRRALLNRLSKSGKYHVDTAGVLSVLVFVVQEQGRYQEAEQLQRQVIDIYAGLGYPAESGTVVNAQSFLAQIINLQRRYDDASKLYDQIDVWTAKWEPKRREAITSGLSRVSILLTQGDAGNALEIAQRTYERERNRSGDKSLNTAVARGYYAIALARTSKPAEALQAFKEAIPVLLTRPAAVTMTAARPRRRVKGERGLSSKAICACWHSIPRWRARMSRRRLSAMPTCCAGRRCSGRCRPRRRARRPTIRNSPI